MSKKLFLLTFIMVLGLAADSALANQNLVLRYKFDEGSGTIAADSAIYGDANTFPATMGNANMWVDDPEKGWVANFDGARDIGWSCDVLLDPCVPEVWDPNVLEAVAETNEMTISYWAKMNQPYVDKSTYFMDYWAEGGAGFYIIQDSGAASDQMVWKHDGGWGANDGNSLYVNDVPDANQMDWHMYTWIKDGPNQEVRVYIDTKLVEESNDPCAITDHIDTRLPDPCNPGGYFSAGFQIASGTSGGYYKGRISDLQIYNKALAFEEVEIAFKGGAQLTEQAIYLSPDDEATGIGTDPNLSWLAGLFVQDVNGHVLYLGTSESNVTDANVSNKLGVWVGPNDVIGPDAFGRYDRNIGTLQNATTYYWRIDEVNTTDGNSPWKGDVWSFTTVDYYIVDDFEDYNGTPGSGTNVFNTWTDGYDLDSSGSSINVSTVLEPNGPTNNSSFQSMYYQYASNGTHPDTTYTVPYFSEIVANAADLDAGTDWSKGGLIKAAILYFYGKADNDANETMYLGLEDGDGNYAEVRYGSGPDEDADDLRETSWHGWDIELNDYTVAGVNVADVDKVYLGFDNSVKASRGADIGGTGTVFIDDIKLYSQRCVPEKFFGNLNDDCIIDYDDVKILADKWLTDGSGGSATIWEETMDDDPNGDGWKTRTGTHHDYTISGSKMTWPTGSTAIYGILDSDPDRDFRGDTIIDVNWRATGANGDQGIGVWVNTGNDGTSGSFNSVYIRAYLVGGVQSVAIRPGGGTGGATEITVASGLGAGMLTGHFEIDDVNNSISYSVHDGGAPSTGSLTLYPQSGGGSDQWFSIYSRYDCGGEFDYIKVVSDNPPFAVDEDLTGDSKINFDDFAVQADKWYQTQLFPISP